MSLDRTQMPPFVLPEALTLPAADYGETPNGIRFWSINTGTQPLVRLSLVFHAGTRYQTLPFVSSATLNLISEGTARWSAAEISERIDFYGIYYDTSIDRDYAVLTISCLDRFLPQALELLEEILLRPTFDEKELSIYASKRKQQLLIEREKPSYQARERFSQALFGADHPYGQVSPAEAYDDLTVHILRDFYGQCYTADNLFVVASGQIPPDQRALLAAFLSQISRGAKPKEPGVPPTHSEILVRERREGALQSSLRIGKVLFPKEHPDFNGMQVLSTVLGGYFGSRLVSNLREEKGYTYGIYSAVLNMEHTGYLAISSDVTATATDEAVREIFSEIERLRQEPVGIEELDMVRNIIVGEIMRILDGPFGIADVTIENIQCGTTNQALNAFFDEVRTITPERLHQLALQWLDPESFTTVIIGA